MIDPRRLRVLSALADHGTVTAAARALHLTPSAVSQQLAALESEAGQELLRRRGRRVALTAAGELLVGHANAVAAELERAQAGLAAFAGGKTGRVEVASFASAITQVVAPAVAALRTTAPGVAIRVRDAEGHASVPLLLDGEIDLAITEEHRAAPRADDRRLTRFPLYTEPFDVVLPPEHPLAGAAEVDLGALADEDWVAPLPGNPVRDVVELVCGQAGFAPRVRHTSDDFRAIGALVRAGAGVALAPRNALPGQPVRGQAPLRRVFAAVRRGSEDHPLVKLVRDELVRCAAHQPT
ncbi:LysR family transcriptional regulator [Saccharothrix coeruleofusca]|uniref:LysR family transcriptional regulator n=1 Tax=Saccharothrix coeruleofusca TaxID=33919 RepID=A0A918EB50_9PSEU|nr:LysR family transcriptional regulator [Saccharothrix coeruleofusca]MBP2339915.1 DNA-binding transcriptional LysR family regulator [Saccharothrix coeruleofusca]GGP38658.1 LysR family transcriptional regulator [Saccharothrix coeruleofusca]